MLRDRENDIGGGQKWSDILPKFLSYREEFHIEESESYLESKMLEFESLKASVWVRSREAVVK